MVAIVAGNRRGRQLVKSRDLVSVRRAGPVQATVTDGFLQVRRFNGVSVGQIGNGTCNLQDAVYRTR